MAEQNNFHADRSSRWALALAAAMLLQTAAPAFATTNASASGTFENAEAEGHYRRCEWTPKKEHCYWVQSGGKIHAH
jgi:hypothetical protein